MFPVRVARSYSVFYLAAYLAYLVYARRGEWLLAGGDARLFHPRPARRSRRPSSFRRSSYHRCLPGWRLTPRSG